MKSTYLEGGGGRGGGWRKILRGCRFARGRGGSAVSHKHTTRRVSINTHNEKIHARTRTSRGTPHKYSVVLHTYYKFYRLLVPLVENTPACWRK
jgi:hypothetical protein